MITNKDLNDQYSLFARNIRKNRKRKKLTQEKLAEMCDISLSYLKQIENMNEYKNVTLTVMLTLAKALDTNVSSLFKEEDVAPNNNRISKETENNSI
jgi:transcriptional regulator with XRE-family HTH domain